MIHLLEAPWSPQIFNVTQPFDRRYIGRCPSGQRIFGADGSSLHVLGEDGSFLQELSLPLLPHIVQIEDLRARRVKKLVTNDKRPLSIAFATIVQKPKDEENGLVTWHAGAVALVENDNGGLDAKQLWEFPALVGKNATPVQAFQKEDGTLEVEFDVRLDDTPHELSRYMARLSQDGEADLIHLQDNMFPTRWWNETMAGTGGGFIPYGVRGANGEPLYEIGLVHGQKEVEIYGKPKREYYLGLAIRNRQGEFLYLSYDPDVSPEDFPGGDLRDDVIALYTTHEGDIDERRQPVFRALISRGDSITYNCEVVIPEEALAILHGENLLEAAS